MATMATAPATAAPFLHRPLPAVTTPVPSSTSLSLRPNQVPPPPPSVLPLDFVPCIVQLPPDPVRPVLRSLVVGGPFELSSSEVLAPDREEVPESPLAGPAPSQRNRTFNAPAASSFHGGSTSQVLSAVSSVPDSAPAPPKAARRGDARFED